MSDIHHTKFIDAEVLDDAMRKPSQREAAPIVSPESTNVRMKTKEVEGSLELGDERKAEFLAALSGIEDTPFS